MQELFCNLWNSQTLRYVTATTFGFLLAVISQQVSSTIDQRRLARSVRESLAGELISNLRILDGYLTTFRKNVRSGGNGWPLGRLNTAILERSLDPNINSVLSNVEQVQTAVVFQQCVYLNSDMDSTGEDIRKYPHLIKAKSQYKLDYQLASIAQNMTDLLCNVLIQQKIFASSEPATMAGKLLPLFKSNSLDCYRIWRTSSIPENRWAPGSHIAWVNDMTYSPGTEVTIIELRLDDGTNYARNFREDRWYTKVAAGLMRWKGSRELRSQIDRLAQTERDDPITPNRFSTIEIKDEPPRS